MLTWAKSSWLSYFYSGAAAIILSWVMALVLSGCYFGNYTQNQEADTVSGYYETEPTALTFSTTTWTGTQATTPSTDATMIPPYLSQILSDPVILKIGLTTDGGAGILSENGVLSDAWLPYVPMTVAGATNATNASMNGGAPTQDVLSVTGCTLSFSLTAKGGYVQETGPFNSGTTLTPLLGRIALAVGVDWNFQGGSCQSFVLSCYGDATKCEQPDSTSANTAQTWIRDAIDPFITANVIEPSTFQNYSDLQFSVTYQ